MTWREREKKEGGEIWPVRTQVKGSANTEKLIKEEAFRSKLEKASCGNGELEW